MMVLFKNAKILKILASNGANHSPTWCDLHPASDVTVLQSVAPGDYVIAVHHVTHWRGRGEPMKKRIEGQGGRQKGRKGE